MADNSYTPPDKFSFAPVLQPDTRLVLLGSLPGEASLAAGQYYAHPRNQFWRLLGDVLQIDLVALPYAQRLRTLLDHRIGLWDVVHSARRSGSLDSQLRAVQLNDFQRLLREAPQLRAIGCNGGEAWRRASTWQGGEWQRRGVQVVALPSSSPALTKPYTDKLQQWLHLREWLA